MFQQVNDQFQQHFAAAPLWTICSPGRVNLIGEHTDYNDGFVLPMALSCAHWMAVAPRQDSQIHLISRFCDAPIDVDIANLGPPSQQCSPAEYIKGVVHELQQQGRVQLGFNAMMLSDVPVGAGLSSSAAFELAIARALAMVNKLDWDATAMALLCQRAENHWVGVNCGIMDQLVCAVAEAGHASLIDCRSLECAAVPLPENVSIVVMDTGTRRGLVDSAYNERRQACEAVAQHLGVKALRDVTLSQLEAEKSRLTPLAYQRARHVVSENQRTLDAAEALKLGDAARMGQLMNASHQSLVSDFEVSSDALNTMVMIAQQTEGCLGARMTGAGFGGCAVALVANEELEHFLTHVKQQYEAQTDHQAMLLASGAYRGCHAGT